MNGKIILIATSKNPPYSAVTYCRDDIVDMISAAVGSSQLYRRYICNAISIWSSSDAECKGIPINRAATALLRALNQTTDHVSGPAVVVASSPTTGAPDPMDATTAEAVNNLITRLTEQV